jgi:hypothetical protein
MGLSGRSVQSHHRIIYRQCKTNIAKIKNAGKEKRIINIHLHIQRAVERWLFSYWGLSTAVLPSAFAGAFRSTPQPPYRQFSFSWQFFYGGFAGYLLQSPIPSAVESLLGFYPHYHLCNKGFSSI